MKTYLITFKPAETMPDKLADAASTLGITEEQLIKRFISQGMIEFNTQTGPSIPGESLQDFLEKNDVYKKID
ncbi:MAG: hypothetical protein Q8L20_15655 [Gammaproteobacteria bacterium]|nr:hypothetical protein [Gammaproteobacteria bacterium]